MKTYIVIYKDEIGCPRAWGASHNEEQAEAEAATQLLEYKKGRPEIRNFTRETQTLEQTQS